MKTLKITIVALAIICIAAPTYAQRGGRGGGGGGKQNGGQGAGQGGGQRNGGNPGGNPGGGKVDAQVRGNVNAGGNVGVPRVKANTGAAVQGQIDLNNAARNALNQTNRNQQLQRNDLQRNDPRFADPRLRNDPRFTNNNNIAPRTFANDPNRANFSTRNYDPSSSQFRINNRTVNYGNPNYRPSYSRYNWYNGYSAGPYGFGGSGYRGGSAYGVGYRGGFGNNIGNTLLGLGLSSLTGGGYGYGGGLGGYGGGYGSGFGYPAGWGLGGWGLGSMAYNSGVLAYTNPYYSGIGTGNFAYNYAQPIPVALAGQASDNEIATQNFETAREQFRNGDYSAALASVDAAIKLQPTDAVMHEFRALTQFALGDYRNSAATIHSVLAVGPGWDWATMIGLYPNVEVYTAQLRALEQVVTQNTRQADTRFLLGYQYMAAGHSTDAGKQFQIAAEIMPSDRVAADLSRLNGAEQTAATAPAVQPTAQNQNAPAAPAPPTIDPAKLVGDWKAERADGSKFDVDFSPDNTFTWKFAQADKTQTLTGTYGIENDLLVLQSKEGGAMLGHVNLDSDDKFTFKLLGTPATEQGLAFNR